MQFSCGKKCTRQSLPKIATGDLVDQLISPTHCTELCTVFQLTKRRGPYPSIRGTKTTRPLAIKPRDSSSLAFNEVRFRLNIRSSWTILRILQEKGCTTICSIFYRIYIRGPVGSMKQASNLYSELVCLLIRGPYFHNHSP